MCGSTSVKASLLQTGNVGTCCLNKLFKSYIKPPKINHYIYNDPIPITLIPWNPINNSPFIQKYKEDILLKFEERANLHFQWVGSCLFHWAPLLPSNGLSSHEDRYSRSCHQNQNLTKEWKHALQNNRTRHWTHFSSACHHQHSVW